ncbi:hypothetical protein ACFORO_12630 [Amycolatopsis halotolerans]|uniref:Uncharacterized protein n=1 Tax=Amycolatopsis halotolerans TaxID=330083 RepID=A0ABV7QGL8_9PSEU
MAIALDSSTPAAVWGTANTVTTGSFSPPAGSFLLVFAEGDENTTSFTVTNTGGLTFTGIDTLLTASGSATNSLASWWAYTAAAPGSMTVSIARVNGSSFNANAVKVLVFTGTETSFTGAHGTASSNTKTLTGTQNNSWFWAAIGDNNGSTTDAAGTGCSWNDAETGFGGISGGILKRTSQDGVNGSGTTMSAGSAPSNMSIAMVEIKAAGAAPATPRPKLNLQQAIVRASTR